MPKTVLLAAAFFILCVVRYAIAQPYVAVFDSGERMAGRVIAGWHDARTQPCLDEIPLTAKGRTLRWFQNRTLTVAVPQIDDAGFVEFVGGDRLPGLVVGYVADDANRDVGQPHLLVDSWIPLADPSGPGRSHERVFLDYVKRISWQVHSERRFTPSTLIFRDGRKLTYRGLRWHSDAVQVLTTDGGQVVRFDKLAEIHMPQRDLWKPFQAERLSWGKARSLCLQASGGLVVTGSQATFAAVACADNDDRPRIIEKIERAERRRKLLADRKIRSQQDHKKRMADLKKRATASKQHYAKTMERLSTWLNQLPPAERAANTKRYQDLLATRPKQHQEQLKVRFEQIRKRTAESIAEHLRSTDKQLEELKTELAGNDPTRDSENWYHKLHPAWSVEPLWLRFSKIRTRWSFAPDELPLTRLQPIKVVQRSTIGQGFVWRNGYNVLGKSLRSAGQEYGWGFGVHADNELRFELPESARVFRTMVALDDAAGDGGCARAAIYLNKASGKPLYESPILVGSSKVFDTGRLDLTDSADQAKPNSGKTLILVVRSAHSHRPANTDPFDIRDHINWLEPIVELEIGAKASRN